MIKSAKTMKNPRNPRKFLEKLRKFPLKTLKICSADGGSGFAGQRDFRLIPPCTPLGKLN